MRRGRVVDCVHLHGADCAAALEWGAASCAAGIRFTVPATPAAGRVARGGCAVEMAWFLESIASDGSRVTQPIRALPFRVGRDAGNELAVDARGLSRRHAEIDIDAAGRLQVTDLDSTNEIGRASCRERVLASV